MSKIIVRYCHPCKAAGVKTRCGLGASGVHFDRRSRCEGAIVNVCDMHGDALDVLRANVDGHTDKSAPIGCRTTSARQAAEGALFDPAAAAAAAADAPRLQTARARALDVITPEQLRKIMRAARYGKGQTAITDDLLRDARYDAIMDALVKRLGARAFQGVEIDVDEVITNALYSNTSARNHSQTYRLDAPIDSQAADDDAMTGETNEHMHHGSAHVDTYAGLEDDRIFQTPEGAITLEVLLEMAEARGLALADFAA